MMPRKFLTHFLPKKTISGAIYWFIALSITCVIFANKIPLRINQTASMPEGFYWLSAPREIDKGDFVMICLDDSRAHHALQRGYLHGGSCFNFVQPLLKQVVAITNDTVTLTTSSMQVNGLPLTHSSTLTADKQQRPLVATPRGVYKLQPNQLWVYGIKSDRSWDSRYFGLVKTSDVVSIVKPILTWS
jgi:conjugative transfer signal peptidase TraF